MRLGRLGLQGYYRNTFSRTRHTKQDISRPGVPMASFNGKYNVKVRSELESLNPRNIHLLVY